MKADINCFLIWFCMFILVQGNYLQDNYPKNSIEDANLDTAQLIQKYQYPVETHYVTTEDKYILRLHRIPKPKAPPVLLLHGIEDSSSTWIMMGPDKGLGYYLADNGYDVWMGNARGNRYSRNHTILNPDKDPKFWNFSWHEIGFFDLSAMIDYVLEETGYNKTGYFGHSQGTSSFFVLCSMRPEYNDKITMMHAIAPVAFLTNIKVHGLEIFYSFLDAFHQQVYEVLPHANGLYKSCLSSEMAKNTCMGALHLIFGKEEKQINGTMLPVLFGHTPAGCSIKQLDHYRQLVKSHRFCPYDYGQKENIKRYAKSKPPDYRLEKVTVPVGLYYTYNDNIASELDVQKLAKMLPNVVEDNLYPYRTWSHMTLVWGIDARKLVYTRMLEVMKNYPYI